MRKSKYDSKTKHTLGNNIWRRREVLGISRVELANRVGVTNHTISEWELGKTSPTKDKMRKLANILNCSINDLFSEYRMNILSIKGNNVVEPSSIENVDTQLEYEFKIVNDEPMVSIKTEEPIIEEPKKDHPVTVRLNKYLKETGMTQHGFAKISGVSSGDVWRVKNGEVKNPNGPAYKKVEAYLDKVEGLEKSGDVKVGSGPEPYKCKEQPVQEPISEPQPEQQSKSSISDRLNTLSETLLSSLAELDEIKSEIAKLDKISVLLKEIQGL